MCKWWKEKIPIGLRLFIGLVGGLLAFGAAYDLSHTYAWAFLEPGNVMLGIAVTAIAGQCIVGPLRDYVDAGIRGLEPLTPYPDDPVNRAKWVQLVERGKGGGWIGFFERLLFFAAIYQGKWEIAAGWLVLKYVSKWESWKIVGDVGTSLGNAGKGLDFVLARRQWATRGYVTFLVGTLANAAIAFLGSLVPSWY